MPNKASGSSSENASNSGKDGPDKNKKNRRNYPRGDLEDFSQRAINLGQQEINYSITAVDEKIVVALTELGSLVEKLASKGQVELGPLKKAIQEVSKATKEIASIFPPGCGGPSQE